ncbi:MAG: kinase/pyrophosphorylase [Proteobacteria bacterium]|nr:kinase/pyrophosphorylase [Pseudomonadota bacterium]HQR02487.1 pyruvate, water dikinase regulatory protein [Rhodocyclaceae bacterium]
MTFSRTVFFVSDGTGITAETLGHSLLSQFGGMQYRQVRIPFVDSPDKAHDCVERIREAAARDGTRPIVVSTLVAQAVAQILQAAESDAMILNLFSVFIQPLEQELGLKASPTVGQSHGRANSEDYSARIDAVNFTLAHDDGVSNADLDKADVILVGVSRSGKTPTSLYLALQFGIKAANYPLIPEDFERGKLPGALFPHRHKLFGLTITPERLSQIRQERRPDSQYAALDNCRWEVDQAQRLMRREAVRWLDSTTKSIEEIAATLMQTVKLERHGY